MNKKVRDYYKNENLIFNHTITGIFDNSKKVIKNSIFVVIKGYRSKVNECINEAISNGAQTIVVEKDMKNIKIECNNINIIKVLDTKVELARLFKWYYRDNYKPFIIGVTGTNGKTSVTNYVFKSLVLMGYNVLLIGTEGNFSYVDGKISNYKTQNTTPSISVIYDLIYKNKYHYVIMEVSSQGICEKRVLGIDFNIICYTNITQDHLDYHETKLEYFHAKESIAIPLRENDTIILNKNMDFFDVLKKTSIAKCVSYSINNKNCDISGKIIKRKVNSMDIEVLLDEKEKVKIKTSLIGDFNLENLLATISILKSIGFTKNEIICVIEQLSPVDGRMNLFKFNNFYVLVDFAHTPDGVKQVIEYFKKVKANKIITVIGCGGNRDATKRPIIGEIVTSLSDKVIFTEDNSRNESFKKIINDITRNLDTSKYLVKEFREIAILEALKLAQKDDIVLILGKGNEQYIKKKYNIKFSDLAFIKELGGNRINE